MTEPNYQFEPVPPVARPAATLAALVVLVLVFVAGLVVGQSGVLKPGATPRPSPVSVGQTPAPGSTPGVSIGPLPSAPADAPANFGLFWEAVKVIRDNFVGRDELSDEQITYGAIRGLVDALGDTGHSIFLTPEAVRAERESLGGTVVGIGVLLGERDDRVVVVSVISGGPADRAGIRTGDAILDVNGESVSGLAPEEVAPKVRGEAGSTVAVTVERPATGEQIEFSIVREELHFPAASWTMVPGTNIALLRLIQFSTGAAAELRAARDQATDAGATSFILDLRSNPGGFISEAVDTASLFLSQRTVYIRELADDQRIPVLTNDAIPATEVPVVVLIDEGTASSAEIVSAALKSAGRAELVGETTFGTGTVLLTFDLPDGSAIRLAVERWLTPDGELIFGQGIDPTVPVPLPVDEIPLDPNEVSQLAPLDVPNLPDSQLRRAIELLSQ
ncbi:MAG: S41 family peptidase [Candidatus Limnocylindrales bacterium]